MRDLKDLESTFHAAARNRDYAEFPSPPTFAFASVVAAVGVAEPYALGEKFKTWSGDNLAIFEVLLLALFEHPALRLPTARALAFDLDFWSALDDADTQAVIDRFFRETLAQFEPPLRDWIAQRPGVHGPLGLRPGVDYIPMAAAQPDDLTWPHDTPLPPIDEVKGVQARLARLGYAVGPIDGVWGETSRRALWRYQFECGHVPPSGELDEPTRARLLDVR